MQVFFFNNLQNFTSCKFFGNLNMDVIVENSTQDMRFEGSAENKDSII